MIQITYDPIDVSRWVMKASLQGAGSLVIHVGVVKPMVDDKKTRGIRLVADGDPAAELAKTEAELRREFKLIDVVLVRRLGELRVGDVILVTAVSSTNKNAAIKACDRAVDLLKERRGIRKEELYE